MVCSRAIRATDSANIANHMSIKHENQTFPLYRRLLFCLLDFAAFFGSAAVAPLLLRAPTKTHTSIVDCSSACWILLPSSELRRVCSCSCGRRQQQTHLREDLADRPQMRHTARRCSRMRHRACFDWPESWLQPGPFMSDVNGRVRE